MQLLHDNYHYLKKKPLASGAINWQCEKQRGNGTGINSCKTANHK